MRRLRKIKQRKASQKNVENRKQEESAKENKSHKQGDKDEQENEERIQENSDEVQENGDTEFSTDRGSESEVPPPVKGSTTEHSKIGVDVVESLNREELSAEDAARRKAAGVGITSDQLTEEEMKLRRRSFNIGLDAYKRKNPLLDSKTRRGSHNPLTENDKDESK